MITGLPPYRTPLEVGIRCLCRRYFVVFTGRGQIVGDAEGRSRERASNMKAQFIDAREIPFMQCDCGALLDFTLEASQIVM